MSFGAEGIDLENELAVLEEGEHNEIDPTTQKPALEPDYTLDIIRRDSQGWYLSRKTVFDRTKQENSLLILSDLDS